MELLLLLLAIGIAFLYFYLNSPAVIGAEGERRVNSKLSRKLAKLDYILVNDITLPTVDGTTQVDHIVLSRYGIFVIETKNMSGWIFGGETQTRWTQVMRRHKSQFQNPLRQNYHHVKVIQNLLNIRLDKMENLVVFVGSAKPKTEMPSNVFWTSRDLINYIISRQAVQFEDGEVHDLAEKLRNNALEANKETRRAHIQHVREKVSRIEPATKCPRCGSPMIGRKNSKTGGNFYGCVRYPKCRGTLEAK